MKERQLFTASDAFFISILAALAAAIISTVCWVLVYQTKMEEFRKQAVDRGFAEWAVTDNATGATEYRWNEFATALHQPNPDVLKSNEQELPEKK